MQRKLGGGLVLDDDKARVDVAEVHRWLSEEAYWAKGRARRLQEQLVRDAQRVVGLYDGGRQIGFARAFTDGASFVYLADVYVLEEHRGSGLGVELVREIVENGPYADRTWVLHTRDAAGLYERFGFRHHERLMQRDAKTGV